MTVDISTLIQVLGFVVNLAVLVVGWTRLSTKQAVMDAKLDAVLSGPTQWCHERHAQLLRELDARYVHSDPAADFEEKLISVVGVPKPPKGVSR
jgi:hypothetical protein